MNRLEPGKIYRIKQKGFNFHIYKKIIKLREKDPHVKDLWKKWIKSISCDSKDIFLITKYFPAIDNNEYEWYQILCGETIGHMVYIYQDDVEEIK